MPRVEWQLVRRQFFSWHLWRFVQVLLLSIWMLMQYCLHVQLSDQLRSALARINRLEERIQTRDTLKNAQSNDRKQDHIVSRQKRAAVQDKLDKLLERIARVENRTLTSWNFKTSDRGSFCVQGPPGRNGMPGKNGIPGRDGKDGLPGRDGRDSTDGRDGIPGINGIPGRQGQPGRDGATGLRGERGQKGHKGNQGPEGPPGDPIMCQKEPKTKRPREGSAGATVYIRWGRRVCPSDRGTVLVYEGQVAGWRPQLQQEGGADFLCMPQKPLYSKPPTGFQTRAPLYGIEYGQVEDLFSRAPGQGRQISYLAVPCAVCRVESRASVIMIPARNVCPSRLWTREYHGYLMTDISNGTRPEYICVDADANGVSRMHTKQHAGQALLTSVEGQCGVLPCPEYRQGWELTCVVCTM